MHGLYPGALSSVPRPELGLGATPLLMTLCGFLVFPHLPLQGLCAVLGPERGGGGGLDSQHCSGEAVLPGSSEDQLHHRQPDGRL